MSDTEAKSKPATKRKIRKLREDGMIPNGQDVAGLGGSAAGLLALAAVTYLFAGNLGSVFEATVEDRGQPFDLILGATVEKLGTLVFMTVAPVAGAAVLIAILTAIVFNGGILFAIKPVMPQIDRISPVSGVKRIYGRRGWIETAASYVRIVVWLIFAGLVGWLSLPPLVNSFACGVPCQASILIPPVWMLLLGAVAIMLLAAGTDMLIQTSLFQFEQMMTQSEVTRERKEQHGNPDIRRERKRRERDGGVEKESIGNDRANMCFFNDTGAVGIRFHPQKAPIPRITTVARTTEEIHALREELRAKGFPEMENDMLVRGCMTAAAGASLDTDLFGTFATSLRQMFAEKGAT